MPVRDVLLGCIIAKTTHFSLLVHTPLSLCYYIGAVKTSYSGWLSSFLNIL